jgi:hypothetical protein
MKSSQLFCSLPIVCAAAWGISLFASTNAAGYDIVNRWNATQLDGGGLQRGDPVTLRWSIVHDGQSYSRSGNSQLVQYLDDGWNVPANQRVPSFSNRLWWVAMNRAYQQFGRVSGINMVYVPEQNGAGIDTGFEGDIRIGGENIDGTPGGALADNTFPDQGDMRIDTTRESDGRPTFWHTDAAALRNLMIHESGHGVGLGHTDITGAKSIMEGGLRTDIWGLQFDDVYALNRQYGDPRERNGGNNTFATASPLGSFTTGGSISIGDDAVDSVVDELDNDWVGIDGSTDTDWFKFSVAGEGFANVKLTPVGPSYTTVQQGAINAAAMNDLTFQFFTATPNIRLLTTVDKTGFGALETITAQALPTVGDYYIRVLGKQDANQFYQLSMSLSEWPLAGTSADVNLDGFTNTADWALFTANSYADLAGLTQRDAYQRGDLDLDGDNDFTDFRFFKTAYNALHGANAFDALLAVPEPRAFVLAGIAALGWRVRRARIACRR